MAENPPTPTYVKPEDWKKASEHLNTVEKEVFALAKDEAGNPKPGMNPFFFVNNVINPLREQLAQATKGGDLFLKVLAVKAEEPLTKKFYKPVTFKATPTTPTITGVK